MWTRSALHELIDSTLRACELLVVSKREPWIHHRWAGKIMSVLARHDFAEVPAGSTAS